VSGALSLGVIGGADGPTAVFVTGSPAPLVIYLLAINVLAFAAYGWGWGGTWQSSRDFMHFSVRTDGG